MRTLLSALALLIALSAYAAAEGPPAASDRVLPLPLAHGGQAGFLGPAPSTDDLAAHLRGTLLVSSAGAGAPLSLHYQTGMSASLWRWAEVGAAFSGRIDLDARQHLAGPVEMWARAGPPDLGGLSLQAVLELASARAPFDGGGMLWPSTTTLGAVLGLQRGRIDLVASAAYQAAGDDLGQARYHGLQAAGGLWLTAAHSGPWGFQLGGEGLARLGSEAGAQGPLQVGLAFAAGVRLLDEHGAAAGFAYGQGWGPGLPAHFGAARMGWSYGRRYHLPPQDLAYPPLLDSLKDWLTRRWAQRGHTPAAPVPRLLDAPEDRLRGPVAVCQLPPRLLPVHVLRSCVVAGTRLELQPQVGDVLADVVTHVPPPPTARELVASYVRFRAVDAGLILRNVGENMAMGAVRGLNQFPSPIWAMAGFKWVPLDRTQLLGRGARRAAPASAPVAEHAPPVVTPYHRPTDATIPKQRRSVNEPPNQPCVTCGATEGRKIADHKIPLVQEHYTTGIIDRARMRSVDAVQPQCPTCSAKQGAALRQWAAEQRKKGGAP